MMIRKILLAFVLAATPALGLAQEQIKSHRLEMKAGKASMKGRIKGYEIADYIFPAGAGEQMTVSMKTSNRSAYFNLTGPGADTAFFNGSTGETKYAGAAPASGDYTARVYFMRAFARRGSAANYTISVTLGGDAADAPAKGPDFADGMAGGPDFWEVSGVKVGDKLALREKPSPKGKPVVHFTNGTILKNLGCKNSAGQRWCKIESPENRVGWVNGRYLREGAGPGN